MQVNSRTFSLIAIVSYLCLMSLDPAFAQGGLDKVDTFVDNILKILKGTSTAVVTIAIIWAGYKFLFKQADISECLKILGGGLLIGGAAELAGYLLE